MKWTHPEWDQKTCQANEYQVILHFYAARDPEAWIENNIARSSISDFLDKDGGCWISDDVEIRRITEDYSIKLVRKKSLDGIGWIPSND